MSAFLLTQLTVGQIISKAPLSTVASYVPKATDGTTAESYETSLKTLALVRDKTKLNMRANAFPPLMFCITDWRDAAIVEADFGFAKPTAWRHLLDTVSEGLVLVYPPRNMGNPDEGYEFLVNMEAELVNQVVEDGEFSKYF
jgi:hypothetical protein